MGINILKWLTFSLILSPYLLAKSSNFNAYFKETIHPFWMTKQQGFLPVTGGKLHYSYFIHKEPKANLIIVHGFTENTLKYRELAYELYQLGMNIFLYDHRGHGISLSTTRDKSLVHVDLFQDYVDDLHQLVEQLVEKESPNLPLRIFAHSMGGGITVRYMQTYPDKIQKAVLSTPMVDIATGPVPEFVAEFIAKSAIYLGYDKSIIFGDERPDLKKWTFETNQTTSSKDRFNHYLEDFKTSGLPFRGAATFRWLAEALKATGEMKRPQEMAKIQTPLLMFQAENDAFVDPEGQDHLCQSVKACRLIKVPEAKHEIYFENDAIREPYLTKVAEFLN